MLKKGIGEKGGFSVYVCGGGPPSNRPKKRSNRPVLVFCQTKFQDIHTYIHAVIHTAVSYTHLTLPTICSV